MRQRPAGVIIAAVLLGIAAALLILFAGTAALAMIFVVPKAGAYLAAMIVVPVVFYLVLAGWAIATLVGLVRMRPWARISVMIIGVCTAVVGILSAVLFVAMPTLMARAHQPLPANPAALKTVFFGFVLFSLVVAAIGIFWLVYFALRRTREAFLQPLQPILPGSYPAANFVAPPPPHPSSLDYTHAQPIDPPPPPPLYTSPDPAQLQPAPQPIAASSSRPISITILAVLFLVGCVSLLTLLLLHFPLFLLGFLLHGLAARVLMLLMLLWTVVTGIGLLTRWKPAWYMAMAYYILGILNIGILCLPGKLLRLSHYTQNIATMNPGLQPALDPFGETMFKFILLPSLLIGVAIILFFIVLLWRARWFFGLTPRNNGERPA